MNKVELQSRVDLLRQELDFLKVLYDTVRSGLQKGPLLLTIPSRTVIPAGGSEPYGLNTSTSHYSNF